MNQTRKLTLSAMFLTIGMILPFFTGQIPQVGNMLLPMHIPVLLCGFLCGGKYGLVVGFILPVLRSGCFGMPPMMPTAIAMAFELAAYGTISGMLYEKTKNTIASLICAMIGGRIVWGIVSFILYQMMGNVFTWQIFAAGAFLQAVPGIVVQIMLIPILVYQMGDDSHLYR